MKAFKYLLVFIIVFLISYLLLGLYEYGDQVHYRKFYNDIKGYNFLEAYVMGYLYLTSFEPISIFILWSGSNLGIEKDIYISLLNSILAISVLRLCIIYEVKWYIIILLLSNYYLFVLYTGAERLKISFIIIVFSLIVSNRKVSNLIYLSPLAHLQSMVLIVPKFLSDFQKSNLKRVSSLFRNIFLFGIFASIIFFLKDGLIEKFSEYYSSSWNFLEIIQLLILMTVYFIITKKLKESLLIFIPLFFIAIILGNERVNMIGFVLATFLLMRNYKLNHPLYIMLLFYFVVKSYFFINNIIFYGDGFL